VNEFKLKSVLNSQKTASMLSYKILSLENVVNFKWQITITGLLNIYWQWKSFLIIAIVVVFYEIILKQILYQTSSWR